MTEEFQVGDKSEIKHLLSLSKDTLVQSAKFGCKRTFNVLYPNSSTPQICDDCEWNLHLGASATKYDCAPPFPVASLSIRGVIIPVR
jgi:hypothetical protein